MISDKPKKTLFHRIAKLKKIIQAIIAFLIAAAVMLPASSAYAWVQHTHEWINYEATKVFMDKFNTSDFEKYEMGPIDIESFQDKYRGIAVTSSSKTIPNYTIEEMSLNPRQWIVKGGDWADEPHLYASVRHFFDPLARWGVHYLTDQYEFHSWYDDPKTDARTWGLDHPDNPFSFWRSFQAQHKHHTERCARPKTDLSCLSLQVIRGGHAPFR